MDISVVIVGWNTKLYLEQCLDSLAAAPPRRSMEIIVVDNASTDGTPEMIEARFPGVKLIRSGENLGFAKANNLAIRQCRGRYISLVNPDVKVLPGCLDALADFLDQHPTAGNVGPRILNPDGSLQSSCRRYPTLWNNFCSAAGLATAFKKSRVFAGEHMFYFPHDRTAPVDVLVGCFWMVRREAFEAVGLLDEGFFVYGEDIDWCRRCRKAGWQVVFFPGGEAIHARGGASATDPVNSAVVQQRSVLYYWSKHHGVLGRWGMQSLLFFHLALRYLFALLARLAPFHRDSRNDRRKQISGACLRALFSKGVPHRA
ncbi:MAG TPA: glycosyltransferase family 2 protein [Terriglobia bacterium]|nr:glycosyltransferase family 2 protein [Terriglobia bacterium]